MVWTPGEPLQGGKYTIERVLGEGGCGITYLAMDRRGNRLVIKTLNDLVRKRPDFTKFQKDFLNEALKLAKCTHPHIVKIEEVFPETVPSLLAKPVGNFLTRFFSLGSKDSRQVELWCMVMEYIKGENLWNRVISQGVLSESEALLYIRQIGEALMVVHSQGLLHRDVKPDNIMVNAVSSAAVLIDFGIAGVLDPVRTQTYNLALTPHFAPIEQYDPAAKLGVYTDVYALAATLYYLLAGKPPTAAPAIIYNPLIAPQQINPKISDRVNQAILKGMELKPENRPQSIQEWLALLSATRAVSSAPLIPSSSGLPKFFVYRRAPTIPSYPPVQLISAVGVDYAKLQDLLAAGKWKMADKETADVMLKVAEREKDGWLDEESFAKFPMQDLRTIDRLWVRYSNGRFGFSVQQRIWLEVGGKTTLQGEAYRQFGDRVGWRADGKWLYFDRLTFSLKAPKGHLPFACVFLCVRSGWQGVASLAARL